MSQPTGALTPGLAQTAAEARAALASSAAEAASRQADARRFIVEHGHQVTAGHADVGSGAGDRGRQA